MRPGSSSWQTRRPSETTLRRLVACCHVPPQQKSQFCLFARELALLIRRKDAPEFDRRAQRLVLKFFRRGLSGRLLWKVGCAVIAWRFPPRKGVRHGKGD
ncbi:MAG: hypothetical protein ABIK44_07000 [candidate division WOR-3 bacterium]